MQLCSAEVNRHTILRRHGHDLANIILGRRSEDLAEAVCALLALGAQTRAIIIGLLAVADEIDCWIGGDEHARGK